MEIIRHLRRHFINYERLTIENHVFGGISFLLSRINTEYNIWVYLTPIHIGFSSKHSVNALRKAKEKGVVPFSTIKLDSTPVNTQLYTHLLNFTGIELPSETINIMKDVLKNNTMVSQQMEQAKNDIKSMKLIYEDNHEID